MFIRNAVITILAQKVTATQKTGECVFKAKKLPHIDNQCIIQSCDSAKGFTQKSRVCESKDLCTKSHCDAVRGCVHEPVVCESTGVTAHAYKCNPSNGKCELCVECVDCDDKDDCTIDSFDLAVGCVHKPLCVSTDKCVSAKCVKGKCVHKQNNCDDGNACTVDSCDVATGKCEHKLRTCSCSSGEVGSCDSKTGECITKPKCTNNEECKDNDVTTVDICNELVGCINVPKPGFPPKQPKSPKQPKQPKTPKTPKTPKETKNETECFDDDVVVFVEDVIKQSK